ncbi:MAG: hypothetical protein ACPGTS_00620 [Minisyncoccia bacterium]
MRTQVTSEELSKEEVRAQRKELHENFKQKGSEIYGELKSKFKERRVQKQAS